MIAFSGESHRYRRPQYRWLATLDYPIDSLTYEESEDPEMAEDILEHVQETAALIQCLRADGWTVELDWRPDEASYSLTHPSFQTAAEANQRLRELGIKRVTCFDIDVR